MLLLTLIVSFFSIRSGAQTISITATHDTICVGTAVTFSATASGTATPHYQWYKNSVTVGTDSTGYTTGGLANGDVIICLLSSSVGGPTVALSSPITMVVYTMPSVSLIQGPDSVCRQASITLTDSSNGGTWSTSSAAIATVNNVGHVTGVAAGLDTIRYTITNYCGTDSKFLAIIVKAAPTVLAVSGAAHLCTGASASLYTDSTLGGTWSTSNSAVATVDTLGNVTPLTNGNINVVYSLTNSCGTTNRTKAIVVSSAPVQSPIAGSSSVCQSDTIHLHDLAPGGTWSSSDPNIALVSAAGGAGPGGAFGLLVGVTAGTDTIKYLVINFCGADSETAVITVDPLPVVYPISGADSICPGASGSLTEFATGGTWSSSNASVATVDTSGHVTGVANGTATITYSLTNGCGTTTQTKTVNIYCSSTGVNSITEDKNTILYPNPVHDVLNIKGATVATIHIVNMYGQTVASVNNTGKIELSAIPAGIYFIQLYNAAGIMFSNQRIVKY